MKRIVHLTYAAIKRYGAKRWTVQRGTIEINTNYVVSVGESELQGLYDNGQAAVLWVGGRWMLRYSGGVVEGLNQHGAAQLRRLAR